MIVRGTQTSEFGRVLSTPALEFAAALHSEFETELRTVLHGRQVSRSRSDVGRLPASGQPVSVQSASGESDEDPRTMPGFRVVGAGQDVCSSPDTPAGTADADVPRTAGISGDTSRGTDSRSTGFVEVVAPALGQQISDALRSGAQLWVADFHTGLSHRWRNVVTAQQNLRAVVRGEAFAVDPHNGHRVSIRTRQMPKVSIRPRDLHAREAHLVWESDSGRRVRSVAGLVDFGLFFFHNAAGLYMRGEHLRVHLPGIETAAEAALWNSVFAYAEDRMGFERGFIRATVQVDTFGGASFLEDILFALREHCETVTTGVRAYMSSLISAARDFADISFDDWTTLNYDEPSVTALLDRAAALSAAHGALFSAEYDSTRPEMTRIRVGDPALVEEARELLNTTCDKVSAGETQPTTDPGRTALIVGARTPNISIDDVHANIRRVLGYTDTYLSGLGEYREDGRIIGTAAAELSHSQLWQWLRNSVELTDGRTFDTTVFTRAVAEELAVVPLHAADYFHEIADMLRETVDHPDFTESFVRLAYDRFLVERAARRAS